MPYEIVPEKRMTVMMAITSQAIQVFFSKVLIIWNLLELLTKITIKKGHPLRKDSLFLREIAGLVDNHLPGNFLIADSNGAEIDAIAEF